ncbi:unnamed protein product [Auanema sp. JU1783]|nr:unnamed protein product [Auanema sp. JU1783]
MQQSLRLDHRLHGKPRRGEPPIELTILDESGQVVNSYAPGEIYTVRLLGFEHFRGVLLQSRLSTNSGQIIGSLRGGQFIKTGQWSLYGVDYQNCNKYNSNNSITHINDDKKYEMDLLWTAHRNLGSIQFILTISKENNEYWERWAPPSAFLKLRNNVTSATKSTPAVELQTPPVSTVKPSPGTKPEEPSTQILKNTELQREPSLPVEKATEMTVDENEKAIMEGVMNGTVKLQEGPEESTNVLPFDASLFDEINVFSTNIPTKTSVFPSEPITLPSTIQTRPSVVATEDQIINDVTRRTFKKYIPDRQTALHTDDVHFLNSHAHLQRDFVSPMGPEEICRQANPCENQGVCVVENGKTICECEKGFIGATCNVTDACVNHGCLEGSYCVNDMKGSYTCKCKRGYVGSYCQYECPKSQCLNGGECIMRTNNEIACKCLPGFSGNNCEREINECNYNHCMNGAGCTDLVNDYKCHCSKGWMGKNCDRPCQDVYGSCRVWKREGQCELMRGTTDYFDVNCAASCEQCIFDNTTLTTETPLPPVLLPLAWLLGEWQTHQRGGFKNRTIHFPLDMEESNGYNETITFSVAKGLMFGTPSINYTSIAVADNDQYNVHESNGFITVRQYAPKGEEQITRAALMTVSNTGVTLIEEGDVMTTRTTMGHHLNMGILYQLAPMESKKKLGKKQFRSFVRKGNRLMQLLTREEEDGRITKHSKTYTRTKEFQYM